MLSKTQSSAASRRLFLRAQSGKLSSSRGSFASISGGISKVEYREHVDDKGQHYYNWHLLIDDEGRGEYYDVAFSKFCDGFGYLLSALLTKEGQSSLSNLTIDFSPYKATGTRAVVSAGGRSIGCGESMPALDCYIGEDGKKMYDGSARFAWMMSAMNRVNAAINSRGDE